MRALVHVIINISNIAYLELKQLHFSHLHQFSIYLYLLQLIQEMLCILGLEKSHDFKTSFFEWCYKVQEYGRLEKRRSGVQDVLVKLDACGSMEGTIIFLWIISLHDTCIILTEFDRFEG